MKSATWKKNASRSSRTCPLTLTSSIAAAINGNPTRLIEHAAAATGLLQTFPGTYTTAIVHLVIGKKDFDERRLLENYAAVIDEIIRAKPSAAKGRYIRSITLASTMGPGVKVDPSRTRDILEEGAAAAA